MVTYIENSIFPGLTIGKEQFDLPTGGATVTAVEFVKDGSGMWPTGDFYRVSGAIHPNDSNAYDINFQIGLPVQWNGKLLQICGGGLDGNVTPVDMPVPGSFFGMPSILTQGYVVFSSDGGHVQTQEDPFNCDWGLNDEALENYAYKAIKRNRDLSYALVQIAYGTKPENTYIAGGSNGGRECLKALEQHPEDYDGGICLYPVQSFVAKVLFDSHYGNVLMDLGADAVIPAEKWLELRKKIIAFCDKADGLEDGIVSDFSFARRHRAEIRDMLAKELNEKQLAFLDCLATPLKLPFDLGHGTSVMNEISVYEGTSVYEVINGMPLLNIYGNAPGAADTMSVAGANGIIRNMIVRDPNFDVVNIDYESIAQELRRASKLFDVAPDSLDAFKAKGGKLILAQGTEDILIAPCVTVAFYERLARHYGDALKEMLKFYLVPGYGHGFGGSYAMHVDFVSTLDAWVNEGKAPENLVSMDCADVVSHRTRPLYEYPYYPAYNGEGDVNAADSFHPKKLGDLHIAK